MIGTDRNHGPICVTIGIYHFNLLHLIRFTLANYINAEKQPQPGTAWYRAIVRTKSGDHRFAIPCSFVKLGKHQTYASSQQLLKALKQLIAIKSRDLWVIRDPSCHEKMKQFETKMVTALSHPPILKHRNLADVT